MSNKRLLEDVYGENKAARPWTEQPFDEEDYAYEIETQSVAERVFQMLFGGNLFLEDADLYELWELYRKAPTKQMRDSLAARLGPMGMLHAWVAVGAGQYPQKGRTLRILVPHAMVSTGADRCKMMAYIASSAAIEAQVRTIAKDKAGKALYFVMFQYFPEPTKESLYDAVLWKGKIVEGRGRLRPVFKASEVRYGSLDEEGTKWYFDLLS